MSEPWESRYTRMVAVDDLPLGRPSVFRAGGATVVLRRDEHGVQAIDGSCLGDEGELSREQRVQKIFECVASGSAGTSLDGSVLVEKAGLPVRIDEGAVWVCIDACRQ